MTMPQSSPGPDTSKATPQARRHLRENTTSGWFQKVAPITLDDAASTPPSTSPLEELDALLNQDLDRRLIGEIRGLLKKPLFERHEGRSRREVFELTLLRAQCLTRRLGLDGASLLRDFRQLFALAEWVAAVDGDACSVITMHHARVLVSILAQGNARHALRSLVEELERMDSVGVFLEEELAHGSELLAWGTRAEYDQNSQSFVLSTPSPGDRKVLFGSPSSAPMIGVVMARLFSQNVDRGVFPLVVRLRDRAGQPMKGVRFYLAAKSGADGFYALSFEGVSVPVSQVLAGPDGLIHDDGTFEARIPARRFRAAMDRDQLASVCRSASTVGLLRTACSVASHQASARFGSSSGHGPSEPSIRHNAQAELLGGLAAAYALTFALRAAQRKFRSRDAESERQRSLVVDGLDIVAREEAAAFLHCFRRRAGTPGLSEGACFSSFIRQLELIRAQGGEEEVGMLRLARRLCEKPPEAPLTSTWTEARLAEHPRVFANLLQFRVARLARQLKVERARSAGDRDGVSVSSMHDGELIELARAYGQYIVSESFREAVHWTRHRQNEERLNLLYKLWCVTLIERNLGWFLVEDCLSIPVAKQLARMRARWCRELERHAADLIEAFGLDISSLRASTSYLDGLR